MQGYKDYEIILCEDEGALPALKAKSLAKAKGAIIVFIDDDIITLPDWLANIVTIFDTRPDVVGVTGPTFIPTARLRNRDVFLDMRWRGRGVINWNFFAPKNLLKFLYYKLFLGDMAMLPGRITPCGASTVGANYPTGWSEDAQEVDFLEPCQQAMRRSAIEQAGGIDASYEGVGEWFDVDLCYRLKKIGKLIYHPQVKVHHYPSCDSTADKRKETASRYRNYCRWANKYVEKTPKHYAYRLFIKTYFLLKGNGWV